MLTQSHSVMKRFKFIDLFCGIGGFHQAMSSLGGECVFASDIDKSCRESYEVNYGIKAHGDITAIAASDIPQFDVLCAGFPCQSFSKAGNRKGIDDARGTLFFDILRIAKEHKPKYMLLENVRNLASHDNGRTWKVIRDNLRDIGYSVPDNPVIFSPHQIGIPQHRERVFIMCRRQDLGDAVDFIYKPNGKGECLVDSILDKKGAHLEAYMLSESEIELINIWNEFIQNIEPPLPGFPVWADRLKQLDPSEDLDSLPKWKSNFIIKNSLLYEKNKVFLDKWLPKAWKLELFKGSKAMLEWQVGKIENPDLWENIMQFRPSGLRVKKPTYLPALVAITQTSIVGAHKRYLTPRECARMQSFPESFILHEKDRQSYKQFGNSVNVKLVRMFGDLLLNESFDPSEYGLVVDSEKVLELPIA